MNDRDELVMEELTYDVLGALIEVHRELGPGLLERVYHECVCDALRRRGIAFESRVRVPLTFHGRKFDVAFEADVVVEDCIVLEFKCVSHINPAHKAQCLTYMRFLECPIGFVVNFDAAKIMSKSGHARLVRSEFLDSAA